MIVKSSVMGGKLWLHHDKSKYAKSVVISSHGGYFQEVRSLKIGKDCAGHSKVHFYKEGGKALDLNIDHSVSGEGAKAKVIETHTKDRDPFVMNYQLTKFQDAHGPKGEIVETYDQIADAMSYARGGERKGKKTRMQNLNIKVIERKKLLDLQLQREMSAREKKQLDNWTRQIETWGDTEERDVVSVRNRLFNSSVFLKDVINALHKVNRGYENFYCSFCRVYNGERP